jgi:hypothetical protein
MLSVIIRSIIRLSVVALHKRHGLIIGITISIFLYKLKNAMALICGIFQAWRNLTSIILFLCKGSFTPCDFMVRIGIAFWRTECLTAATTFSVTTLIIKGLHVTLSITTLLHYAECSVLFIVMPNSILLSVVMLSVLAPA